MSIFLRETNRCSYTYKQKSGTNMKRLKSIFISMYLMVLAGLTFYLGIHFEPTLSWASASLSVMPSLLFFIILMGLRPTARTNPHVLIISFPTYIGLACNIHEFNTTFHIISLAGTILWIVYLYWYSIYPSRSSTSLTIGEKLPKFHLKNENDTLVSSKSFIGKPLLLIFYRGNWCPLCMAQIKEIAKEYHSLSDKGLQIAFVSPQNQQKTKSLSDTFKLPFIFLTDEKNALAKQLNILDEKGIPLGMEMIGYDSETVMPTVLMTNKEGTIIFLDQTDNYRTRPEPSTYLDILTQNGL